MKPEPPHGAIMVLEEPCRWCAVWIGPHRHWLREDGSLGLILEPLSEDEVRDVLADMAVIEGRA